MKTVCRFGALALGFVGMSSVALADAEFPTVEEIYAGVHKEITQQYGVDSTGTVYAAPYGNFDHGDFGTGDISRGQGQMVIENNNGLVSLGDICVSCGEEGDDQHALIDEDPSEFLWTQWAFDPPTTSSFHGDGSGSRWSHMSDPATLGAAENMAVYGGKSFSPTANGFRFVGKHHHYGVHQMSDTHWRAHTKAVLQGASGHSWTWTQ